LVAVVEQAMNIRHPALAGLVVVKEATLDLPQALVHPVKVLTVAR
jgi:hypothetical protein